jgi:hypothetical protein
MVRFMFEQNTSTITYYLINLEFLFNKTVIDITYKRLTKKVIKCSVRTFKK